MVGVGFIFVWKTEWFLQNFGRIGFGEKYLGTSGGSRLMYKLIGLIIIVIGFMYTTDLTDNLLAWIASTFFRQKV